MFCTNCGNQLKDNALFCGACGTPVSKPQVEVAAPVIEVAPQVQETPVVVDAPAQEVATPVVAEIPVVEEQTPVVEEKIPVVAETISVAAEVSPVIEVAPVAPQVAPVVEQVAPAKPVAAQNASPVTNKYQGEITAVSKDLKKSFGSVLAIVAIVLYLVAFGIRILSGIMTLGEFSVSDTLDVFSIDSFEHETLLNIGFWTVLFIGLVPMLLMLIGFIFNATQSYRKQGFSSAGFVLVKTATIVKLVINALAFVIFAAGAAFTLIWMDGIVDSAKEKLLADNAIVNFDPLTNALKWIVLSACLFVAVWKAADIVHNSITLFSAKRMNAAMFDNTAKQRNYVGLRAVNYVLVCFNGIILSVQLVLIILNEKVVEFISQLFEDMNLFSSSDISVISDVLEQFRQFFGWGAIATVLMIAILLMFNANISNHTQSKEYVEIQK